jgi:Zn-dependent peptidase ImmA (M78 family)
VLKLIPALLISLSACSANAPPVERSFGPVGSAIDLPRTAKICVQRSKELTVWPVDDAIYNWNKNGTNLFVSSYEQPLCNGIVIINETPTMAEFLGSIEFFDRSVIVITLNSRTPVEHRKHTICHELGHALGLAHSTSNSCMDINQYNTEPTKEDLSIVSQKTWSAAVAAREMGQHK